MSVFFTIAEKTVLAAINKAARKRVAARKAQEKGIPSIKKNFYDLPETEDEAGYIAATFKDAGLWPLDKAAKFIKDEKDVIKYLNIIKSINKQRTAQETLASGLGKYFKKEGEVIPFPQSAITDWRKPRPTTGKKGEVIDTSFASGVDKSGKRTTMSNADYSSLKEEYFRRIMTSTDEALNTFLKRGINASDERFKNFTPKQRKDFLEMVDYRLKHGNEKFMNDLTDAKGKFKLPEDLAYGGIAGMLGEPTYQDDNHRVPLGKGKLAKYATPEGLAKLIEKLFPGTTKIGKTSKPMAEKTQLRKAIADFQERQKNKIISHAGDAPKAGEGRFTKAEAVIMRLENTIKAEKKRKKQDEISKYVLETYPNWVKEIKAKPELANNQNVWDNLMGDLPKNQQFVVYGDDTVDFFTQSKFGPHNIASKKAFHKKHPYLTEEEAVKISSMEPNDQVMELKRLQTLRTTKHADGGRVPMWLGGGLGKGKDLLRAIMKHHAETGTTGLTGSKMLQLVNPKQFNEMLNKPEGIPAIAKEMIEKYIKEMKVDRVGAVEHSLGLAKKMKKAKDKSKEMDKITEALTKDFVDKGMDKEMVEGLIEMFLKAKYPDYQKVKTIKALPNVTDEAILELENIGKNLATKGRKLNASGGLAGMLGE